MDTIKPKILALSTLFIVVFGLTELSAQGTILNDSLSINKIPRNSVYLELGGLAAVTSINYERLVPLGNESGLGFRLGLGTAGYADTTNSAFTFIILGEINYLYGKSKHFFEPGIGIANAFVSEDTEQWISIKLGYRYQGKKGFLLKIAPMYIYNFEVLNGNDDVFDGFWLGVGFGYSF